MLNHAPFDLKKEAAYAVANIGSEKQYLPALVDAGVVQPFALLLRVPDEDVVLLSLAFLSSILRFHPEEATLLEEENVVEYVENLQYHSNQYLGKQATALTDLFYNVNDEYHSKELVLGI